MLVLFGQPENWHTEDFVAADDRVRGGASVSHLSAQKDGDNNSIARFWGNLDIKKLGGAGFASQKTVFTDRVWDLREFEGIELDIARGDGFKYTFNIKTDLATDSDDHKATLVYEFDFEAHCTKEGQTVYAPFHAFKPTYMGRPVEGAPSLDNSHIVQFSIMIRSFFGKQSGEFNLVLNSIRAKPSHACPPDETTAPQFFDDPAVCCCCQ
ncbi:CIA30 family protein [Schizosaccharomyces japonicus yFS275]|uniref:CIA30 family protein n=1 Tax=Schizosaccharomyces japonicus (strain yFS275 / FY16936) TaxID=402676 RepID=B6K516_SCHJY|nr:CIA30 family protein [Schizosaccharomyces japonicus yFS275]EEB08620.1 CIA30 family protein [Schizosaccharomyces japonicus yFS275]